MACEANILFVEIYIKIKKKRRITEHVAPDLAKHFRIILNNANTFCCGNFNNNEF